MTSQHLFNLEILKYPRTPHLRGSRLQAGDSADDVPYAALAGRQIVVEEKLDGANAALSCNRVVTTCKPIRWADASASSTPTSNGHERTKRR